jgi:hypothetical protein
VPRVVAAEAANRVAALRRPVVACKAIEATPAVAVMNAWSAGVVVWLEGILQCRSCHPSRRGGGVEVSHGEAVSSGA